MNNRVSIIIPTLNEYKYIGGLLQDLKEQIVLPKEVIVADCSSTDDTLTIAKRRYSGILIAESTMKSPGAARNAGAKKSSGDILLFIDCDIRVEKDFLKTLLTCIDETNADVLYPKFLSDGMSAFGTLHIAIVRSWLLFYRNFFTEKGIGGVIFVKREAYDRIGGFEESINESEDVLFFKKAHKLNMKIKYCKQTSVRVSSRRTRGTGFFYTAFEDLSFFNFARSQKNRRSYDRYK